MRRVVYTSADAGTPVWDVCGPTVERWVGRCNAELVNLPAPKKYQPQWVIFDAFEDSLRRGEGQYAWIDSDILVADDAPDIFSSFADKFFFTPPEPPSKIHPNMRDNFARWGMPSPRPYLVSALVKWSPRHVEGIGDWFAQNQQRFSPGHGDQELLTVAMFELERHHAYFPENLHNMTKLANADTKFLHAAGGNKRKKINYLKSLINQ